MDAGAREYRGGNFAAAEGHFRRALELDPSQTKVLSYIARAVHQQYRPGGASAENLAAGGRAVAAYREVLQSDPTNEEAYKATVFLYGQMKQDDKVLELLTRRADDPTLPDGKRAEALVVLASRRWACSFDITERKENKFAVVRQGRAVIAYKKPRDQSDYDRASGCAREGLQFAERALRLDPDSPTAWTYKANLLREASKLAEMNGDFDSKADYDRRYAAALETGKRVSEEAAKKMRAEAALPGDDRSKAGGEQELITPVELELSALVAPVPLLEDESASDTGGGGASPPPRPEPGVQARARKVVVEGGILNGKAVSKPEPEYPPAAKAARVQGQVTVRVLVDEKGNVVEARAISGHRLLTRAAVAAARRARFAPTLLVGQPVKVRGVITYNFKLP